jgi:GT2 family glycosyltransferase
MFDFNSFRLTWDKRFLVPDENRADAKGNEGCHKVYGVNARLPKGWYMLEINVRAEAAQVKGHVIVKGLHLPYERIDIAASSRRLTKRLIRLNERARIDISLDFRNATEGIENFRLVRVTRRFSRSRMLKKLQALHPKYRLSSFQDHPKGARPATRDWRLLWQDYCNLFDQSAELATYPEWIERFEVLADETRAAVEDRLRSFRSRPLITIVMTPSETGTNAALLETTLRAIVTQNYPHWEMRILSSFAPGEPLHALLMSYAKADPRVHVISAAKANTTESLPVDYLDNINGEWITFVQQNDALAEHALFHAVETINQYPDTRLIYSDEDHVDSQHQRSEPHFKCEWNIDLFRSQDMFGNLGLYRTTLFKDVGGLHTGFGAAARYGLTLRCVERCSTTQIRHIARILYHKHREGLSASAGLLTNPVEREAGRLELAGHLARMRIAAEAITTAHGYRVRYPLPDDAPLVSLIIPTRNGLTLLRRCIESIVAKTTYKNYEIIVVDNGSDDIDTIGYLDDLARSENVHVLRDDRPFNYSALNNLAVKEAHGPIIGLVNNDIEVISPEWLTEMVSQIARPEVGVVGAKLLYSDDTVQHAGVIMGLNGAADHLHRGLHRQSAGYQSRAMLIQSFSAVTAACLLVKKELYVGLGGLNESTLTVAFNDIDFCLRVNEAGYSVLWTPYAELYHHESASRGEDDTLEKQERANREATYMFSRWSSFIAFDPAYNSNLCLEHSDCRVAWPPRISYRAKSNDSPFRTPTANGSNRYAHQDRQQSN